MSCFIISFLILYSLKKSRDLVDFFFLYTQSIIRKIFIERKLFFQWWRLDNMFKRKLKSCLMFLRGNYKIHNKLTVHYHRPLKAAMWVKKTKNHQKFSASEYCIKRVVHALDHILHNRFSLSIASNIVI